MKKLNHLVIVESPTKAHTIEQFLGPDFRVVASMGHVRDLPKSELGVDEETFEPRYVIPPKARKTIKLIKELIKDTPDVYIATDLDREGEAIGWHVAEVTNLSPEKLKRITFHEITKSAIEESLKHPRQLNQSLIDAQQARRILDRLVGYKLSPLLWKKIARGLSAGRVQSVAVRLIVDREREIEKFKPQEYWTIEATLEKDGSSFVAVLVERGGKKLEKLAIGTPQEADTILAELAASEWRVADLKTKITSRNPLPPFTTSTLQQEAAHRLGWSAAQTMRVAQSLYEEGFITYHRTDSVSLAPPAIDRARTIIEREFGKDYLPAHGRQFKTKVKGAQEAHEAIRPAYPDKLPPSVELADARERKLYDLIWRRFLASQMNPAAIEESTVDIAAKDSLFRANGAIIRFDGFMKVWSTKMEERRFPALSLGDLLKLAELAKRQHFTEPPPRYNMASLIKTLEEFGIGRPSTYAPIISTIIDRNYVTTTRGVFSPTDLGKLVTDLLVEHFPEIVDVSFTAHMEEDLDAVAQRDKAWQGVLADFYRPFATHLAQKQEEIQKSDYQELLDEKCPESGHQLVVKMGRFGKFIACTGFPECKYTKAFIVELNMACPECGKGRVVERRTRRGKMFWGCSRYPECRWATWKKPVVEGQTANPTESL